MMNKSGLSALTLIVCVGSVQAACLPAQDNCVSAAVKNSENTEFLRHVRNYVHGEVYEQMSSWVEIKKFADGKNVTQLKQARNYINTLIRFYALLIKKTGSPLFPIPLYDKSSRTIFKVNRGLSNRIRVLKCIDHLLSTPSHEVSSAKVSSDERPDMIFTMSEDESSSEE